MGEFTDLAFVGLGFFMGVFMVGFLGLGSFTGGVLNVSSVGTSFFWVEISVLVFMSWFIKSLDAEVPFLDCDDNLIGLVISRFNDLGRVISATLPVLAGVGVVFVEWLYGSILVLF